MEQFGVFTAYAFVTRLRGDKAYRRQKVTLANATFVTYAEAKELINNLQEQNPELCIFAQFTVSID